MRVTGIIAEYNPFHSGHAYQMRRARAQTGCERVIVAMAGAFTQRGEPALIDKWTRAKMALECGADVVFELPCLFALREARGFAEGGVSLLNSLGVVDALSFGCEAAGVDLIAPVAECLNSEPDEYRALLREGLDAGNSYPAARARAAAKYLSLSPEALAGPNFSLALEYAQAIKRQGANLKLAPVPRTSDHNAQSIGEICSAGAIRAAIDAGDVLGALKAVPESLRAELEGALKFRARPDFFDDLALLTLRDMAPEELKQYPGAREGLEHLIINKARDCASASELISEVKSKRYTYSRIKRLISQATLGITSAMQAATPLPTYARVLGCRRDALPLLGEIKRRGALPLITDVKRLSRADPLWLLETRATDVWGLCTACPAFRRSGLDYTHRFLIVD